MNQTELTHKLIVLGIDGLDPSLAKKFIAQGDMPNLAALLKRGAAHQDLLMLGAHPTVTPPMWTTLATGAYPMTHGITGFFNQHPSRLDTAIYALDSRQCKAEQIWNVFAEAGKNTLVWHWPGSSWPPTSDSPQLSVVDGTQPNTLGFGTAMIDWDKLYTGDATFTELSAINHDQDDQSMAGCVMTNLEDTVALIEKIKVGEMTGALARKTISSGKTKDYHFLVLDESETEITMLCGSNADFISTPIVPAVNWLAAPEHAKECVLMTSNGLIRRPCLILPNAVGVFDRMAIYQSKQATQPLLTLPVGQMISDFIDEIYLDDGTMKTGSRCVKLLDLAADGSQFHLWFGHATDIHNALVWHPKSLHQEITENVGNVPLVAQCSGSDPQNVTELLLPSWNIYTKWQGDCLTYLMDQNRYDIIFSHIHNVDALGHKFWHYAKHRPEWNNDEAFYQKAINEVYRQTDRYIGQFLPYIDLGWTVMVLSDHGLITEENHPPILTESTVSVPVMQELGYTVLKKDENGADLRGIDWSKTRAIAIRGGQIYLNLKGRDPEGIVEPADKYDLEHQIISDLYNYRDPHTGKRVVSIALRNKDAIVLGEGGPGCGDIIFFMEEGFNIIHMDSLTTQKGYHDTSVAPFFAAAGPGIKAGFLTDRLIRQVDIAPTIAVLGGVRMPAQCEGAVIYQILDTQVS